MSDITIDINGNLILDNWAIVGIIEYRCYGTMEVDFMVTDKF